MNWEEACQILGVPVTANTTEIQAQYRYKAQLLHPDKTAGLAGSLRQKAEEEFKRVSAAYDVLNDPRNNPQANPPKLGVSPRYIRFKDVEPNQKKTTTIEIESIGGSYTKFWMDDSPAAWLKVIEVKSTTNDPLPLEVTIEASGSS
jgi:curved DNA-binding protein CbpA